jgi:hypothetical protein
VARELDILGGASIGGWLRRHKERHLAPAGAPCANCETPLAGAYCYTCGQLAEQFERSVWRLAYEVFEDFFHFDGRLFQTMPKLALRPGRLTRDYLDGKRAYQIPPLRMFLIVILVLFFAAGINMGATGKEAVNFNTATPAQKAQADAARAKAAAAVAADPSVPQAVKSALSRTQTETANKIDNDINVGIDNDKNPSAGGKWLRDHLKLLAAHREQFTMLLEERAHWVAIGMLPVAALILGFLFLFKKKRYYIFDHLIFTMHSLSFQGLLLSTVFLLDATNVPAIATTGGFLMFASPVHLFVHMRGTYQSSIFGTLLRMAVLWVFSVIGFSLLFMAMLWSSIAALG